MAWVHGNEKSGIHAIKMLKSISLVCWELILINANIFAQKKWKRYIEKDLNRCFGQKKEWTLECRLATIIEPYIQACDTLLDIHNTTGSTGVRFVICEQDKHLTSFDVDIHLSGLDVLHPGWSDWYANTLGKHWYCLESGSIHEDILVSTNFAYQSCLNLLKTLGQVKWKPKVYTNKIKILCKDIYKTQTHSFLLSKNFWDFEEIKKGQLIAFDWKDKIFSQEDWIIIFPYKQEKIGNEWFVFWKKLD